MVDTGIFATTTEVQYKAGANASATANTEAYINSFMAQAESEINVLCEYNFSDTYTSLNADVKGLLKQAASNRAAMYVINYDWSGFPSMVEVQGRLDLLDNAFFNCINLLKEKIKQDFIKTA